MKEAYVKFETAKLLKEKGFCEENIYCYYQGEYENDSTDVWRGECKFNWNIYDDSYSAPTQQMACSWLRERGIHIMPTIGCDVDRTPRIFYGALIALFNDYGDIDYHDPLDENGYNEPEEAIEAALEYVLKNLI